MGLDVVGPNLPLFIVFSRVLQEDVDEEKVVDPQVSYGVRSWKMRV